MNTKPRFRHIGHRGVSVTRRRSAGTLLTLIALAGCLPNQDSGGPTSSGAPTTSATPSGGATTYASPSTAAAGVGVPGTWSQLRSADGLCTNSPRLIGASYVAEGTTICTPSEPVGPAPGAPTAWSVLTVPVGDKATAAVKFPPGGGLVVSTDDGPCVYNVGGPTALWDCRGAATGYPYLDIVGLANIATQAVIVLPDVVVHLPDLLITPGSLWDIGTIVAAADAMPTRIATIENPSAEVWVGTNGHGVVVIDPVGGTTSRHLVTTGLPADDVRDLASGSAHPKFGAGYPVWAATAGGVGRWDGSTWTVWTTADGLPSNDVRAVAVDDTTVWVATAGGIASFDGTAWHAYGLADGVPSADVMDVALTSWGVWFATPADGLLVFIRT